MNAVEMQHYFQAKLRPFGAEMIYNTYQIQSFLNEAQKAFIDRYIKLLKIDDLAKKKIQPLIDNYSLAPSANASDNISSNAQFVTLPTDIYKTLNEFVTTSGDDVKVKPVSYDEYNINIDNPHKKPDSSLVWRLDYGDESVRHELITDGTVTPVLYKLRYIKYPTDIDIYSNNTSDLNSSDHFEIVNIAVSLAVPSPREDTGSKE